MSASATIGSAVLTREDPEKGHRIRVFLAWMLALAFVLVIASYGMNYYTLSASQRPFSPKHQILRPSGTIGVKLGMVGVLMFFLIYLYPLRKKWGWLGRMGNSRHWLDFHIVLGTAAPIIVAFHASFKFGNIAGMAFYSMLMVTLSGFVGRYLYSHIPRSLSAAELSMKEIQEKEEALRKELAEQKATFGFSVDALAELPSPAQLAKTPLIASLLSMFVLDIKRPFRTSLLRLQQAGFGSWVFSGFGMFSTRNLKLERAILLAQKQSSLSQSIAFLSRTQRIFQLWHVIHRPFSYAFAILAILHICLALSMGYRL
jgi:TRAP-type C4-dicarboxylate transport system permease small subunit